MACATPAMARISSHHVWGLSRGKPAPHRARRAFLLPRKQQGRRDGEGAGKAGPGFTLGDRHSPAGWEWLWWEAAHGSPQHTLPPPRCHARRLSLAAWPALQGKTLIILFLSAFSHLPPSLGSASQRWVDRRLSGAAASPTASPACLMKPAQRFLPFWAKCFLLWTQVTGKSLVSGIQSILCPQPIVGTGKELAEPHREETLIDALISKPQAAIHSPTARNHEGISLLSSRG